ncbi:mCpol domain-containing protein [Saccharopolyspora rosea]|uniref:mCpol domain-containing protein n=1 Tax=Saccharopolyspora rosea TaxID=524884 RepID=UPI0021DAFE1B|nr:mCpol domain-containing protein [Saccharopolyspora rosea]
MAHSSLVLGQDQRGTEDRNTGDTGHAPPASDLHREVSVPRKRARINYWVVDFKDFSFWIALAFVAGAGPNLAGAISNWLLLGLWGLAAIFALIVWIRNKRRKGIGVYVNLPRSTDKPASRKDVTSIYKAMSRHHRDWFRSGPDPRTKTVDERAEWLLSTIEHRLDELEVRDGQEPPVFLYVDARNEGAFLLGRKTAKFRLEQQIRQPLLDTGTSARLFFELQVKTYSRYEGGGIHELDLSRIQREVHLDIDHVDSIRTETYPLTPQSRDSFPPRLALIVHADDDPRSLDRFRENALAAASAGTPTNGYLATEDDRCDHALFVSICAKEFYDKLKSRSAEPFVAALLDAQTKASNRLYGAPDVPVRLFMHGPPILAFAAGALLPHGSKYVPFDPSLIPPPDHSHQNSDPTLIAIIDGDDVGAGTEKHLLSRDLDKAVRYSSYVTDSIGHLIVELDKIPNVELISQGGDSAIFAFAPKYAKVFESTLENLRNQKNFRVSCGYGKDSREAFLALRLAKSSGKNITIGYGH